MERTESILVADLCDGDMTPLKFLHHWYNFIYSEGTPLISMDDYESTKAVNIRDRCRVNRLAYPDECTCSVYIMKSEPNSERANGRIPVTFVLENAYPYSVDAVPLSYGTSQITRVNVSLYYLISFFHFENQKLIFALVT